MYNWSTDITRLKKDKKAYTIWRLEQMVNFGLGKEKIRAEELKENWNKLNLDPLKKNFLKMLLWPK